jgi:hypothetical protein
MSARKSDLSAKSDLNRRRPPPEGYAKMNVTRVDAERDYIIVL